jgi:predicted anti-sigma-YlaC factor YlaD
MPVFPGSLNANGRGYYGQMTHPGQPQYANQQDSRPSLPEKERKHQLSWPQLKALLLVVQQDILSKNELVRRT